MEIWVCQVVLEGIASWEGKVVHFHCFSAHFEPFEARTWKSLFTHVRLGEI